jgi:hypothetical protein
MIKRLYSAVAFVAVATYAAPAAAQTPPPAGQSTGNAITGVVRDASGGVVRGAAVIATPASGPEARVLSGQDGRFTVTPGGSGAVVLVVRATGFSDAVQRIAVGANRQNLEIVLGAAPLKETVTVSPPPPPPKPPPPPPRPPRPPKPPPLPGAPVINLGYGGLIAGMAAVQNTGRAVGGEAGMRAWRNLDLLAEGGSFSDVVTSTQLAVATPLTDYLAKTQGKSATSSVKRPAAYGAVGARWVFENVQLGCLMRPYAQFSVGAARVERKPTFTLGGADVTSTLGQYGLTLGADLTGTERHGMVTGGFGVLIPIQMWYVDVAYRLTSIKTVGQSTNINRLHFGVGVRF